MLRVETSHLDNFMWRGSVFGTSPDTIGVCWPVIVFQDGNGYLGMKYLIVVLWTADLFQVWSAPNYCYRCGNVASILSFNENMVRFHDSCLLCITWCCVLFVGVYDLFVLYEAKILVITKMLHVNFRLNFFFDIYWMTCNCCITGEGCEIFHWDWRESGYDGTTSRSALLLVEIFLADTKWMSYTIIWCPK